MSAPWPDGPALLELERTSRRQGSGLEPSQLIGTWMLEQIWPRRSSQPAGLSAAILRGLGASLTLKGIADGADVADTAANANDAGEPDPAAPLRITNRVRLGGLELRFQGRAWLEGRRPLLRFRFEQVQVQLGGRCWLDRALAGAVSEPAGQSTPSTPFFALIASGAGRIPRSDTGSGSGTGGGSGTVWLAARGRGGGLALWRREEPAAIVRV